MSILLITLALLNSYALKNVRADELDKLPVELLLNVFKHLNGNALAASNCLSKNFSSIISTNFHMPTIEAATVAMNQAKSIEDSRSLTIALETIRDLEKVWNSQTSFRKPYMLNFLQEANKEIVDRIIYVYKNVILLQERTKFLQDILSASSGNTYLQNKIFSKINLNGDQADLLAKYSSSNTPLQGKIFEKFKDDPTVVRRLAGNSNGNTNLQDKIFEKFKNDSLLISRLSEESKGNIKLQDKILEKYSGNTEITLALASASNGNADLQNNLFNQHINDALFIKHLAGNSRGNTSLQDKILERALTIEPDGMKGLILEALGENSNGNTELQKKLTSFIANSRIDSPPGYQIVRGLTAGSANNPELQKTLSNSKYLDVTLTMLAENSAGNSALQNSLYSFAKNKNIYVQFDVFEFLSRSTHPEMQEKILQTVLSRETMKDLDVKKLRILENLLPTVNLNPTTIAQIKTMVADKSSSLSKTRMLVLLSLRQEGLPKNDQKQD